MKHPKGLYVLFFTELWERYSFYSMMAILALYMNEALHFDVAHVGQVYGLYQAGVYMMPVAGGLIADRYLGFTRAIHLSASAPVDAVDTVWPWPRSASRRDHRINGSSSTTRIARRAGFSPTWESFLTTF